MVQQFNQRSEDTKMPCKYHAVRQVCGDYFINLTPGNLYMYPKYCLESLWLGIRMAGQSETLWEGRTTNKKAVKVGDKPVCERRATIFVQSGQNL